MPPSIHNKAITGHFILWLAIMTLGWCHALAQDQRPPSLFIFALDTSYSMSRLSRSAFESVSNLVASGLQDQIKPGDPLLAWTFNEVVSTNRLGPVYWDPPLNQVLAKSVLKHLKLQRFEKRTRFDPLWVALKQAAQKSEALTAVIVTDGDDTVSGTPFDKALNDIFFKYGKELRRMRKPFVVTMQAVEGQFLACNVCAAGVAIPFDELAQQISKAMPPAKPKEPIVAAHNIVATPPPEIKPNIPPPDAANIPPATVPSQTKPGTNSVESTTAKSGMPAIGAKPEPETAVSIAKIEDGTNAIPIKVELPAKEAEAKLDTLMAQSKAEQTNINATATAMPTNTPSLATTNTLVALTKNAEPVKSIPTQQTNALIRPKTNAVSGFQPKPQRQAPSIVGSPSNSTAIAKLSGKPSPSKSAIAPLLSKANENNLLYWIAGGAALLVVLGAAIAINLVRRKRALPQASFISRGIERHLR